MSDTTGFSEFQKLLSARHSCRGFLPDQVAGELITKCVEAAQKVPSWCNAQPWKLIVTRGAATEDFREAMGQAVADASHNADVDFPTGYSGDLKDRRSICGWQLYDAVGVKKGDRAASGAQMMENYRFFGAPHVAVVTSPVELGAYGLLDCGAFVTAFMLAAEAMNVASIAQAAIAGYSDQVRAHFDIPADRNIICVISFGYRDEDHPANGFRTERAGVADVVDWR